MVIHARTLVVAAGIVIVAAQAFAQEGADAISTPRRPAPWFDDPSVRKHFKLTEEQHRRLNETYQEALTRYQKGLSALDAEADAELRRKKTETLENEFDEGMIHSIDSVFTNKEDKRRYEQFYRRYQGYDVFHTPRLRAKLDLTSEQADELDEHEEEWEAEVAEIRERFSTDRPAAMRDLKHARRRMEERIWDLLTPEQQQTWLSLIGEKDEFPDQLYVSARYREQEPSEEPSPLDDPPTYRVSELLGKSVTIQDNQAAGEIVDLVGRQGGPIEYAVASYESHYYAIPYSALTLQPGVGGFFVDITPAAFGALPFFTAAAWPNFFATNFQQTAFATFNVEPPVAPTPNGAVNDSGQSIPQRPTQAKVLPGQELESTTKTPSRSGNPARSKARQNAPGAGRNQTPAARQPRNPAQTPNQTQPAQPRPKVPVQPGAQQPVPRQPVPQPMPMPPVQPPKTPK